MFEKYSAANEIMMEFEKTASDTYNHDLNYSHDSAADALDCLNKAAALLDEAGLEAKAELVTAVLEAISNGESEKALELFNKESETNVNFDDIDISL